MEVTLDFVPKCGDGGLDRVLLVALLELPRGVQDVQPLKHHLEALNVVSEVLGVGDVDQRLEGASGHILRVGEVGLVEEVEVRDHLILATHHELHQLVDLVLFILGC